MSNVLFVTASDLTGSSGNSIATKEMITAFAQDESLEVSVVCPAPSDKLPQKLNSAVSNFHFVTPRTSLSITNHFKTQITIFYTLFLLFVRKQFDLLILRHGAVMIAPTVLASAFNLRYVYLVRGLAHERMRFSPLLKQIFRINVRLADDVYCAYDEIIQRVQDIRPSSLSSPVLFPNAVDPDKFIPRDMQEARQEIVEIENQQRFVVGFVGSLKERHCLSDVIESLDKLPNNIHLLIVGDGPKRNSLEQLVSDRDLMERVTFTGIVQHDAVSEYIAACDIMYGVTHPEIPSNPIKNYEYLACGRPIVSDQTLEFEFVEQINAGIAVETVTVDEISSAIRQFESLSQAERLEMGRRGREYVLENHTWDALVELIIERNL